MPIAHQPAQTRGWGQQWGKGKGLKILRRDLRGAWVFEGGGRQNHPRNRKWKTTYRNNEHRGGLVAYIPACRLGSAGGRDQREWHGKTKVLWDNARYGEKEAGRKGKQGNEQTWRIPQRSGKRHTWSWAPNDPYERTEQRTEQSGQKNVLFTRHLALTWTQTVKQCLDTMTEKSDTMTLWAAFPRLVKPPPKATIKLTITATKHRI